jgi:hypothetical protein
MCQEEHVYAWRRDADATFLARGRSLVHGVTNRYNGSLFFAPKLREPHVLLQRSSKSSPRYGSAGRPMFGLDNDSVWLSF